MPMHNSIAAAIMALCLEEPHGCLLQALQQETTTPQMFEMLSVPLLGPSSYPFTLADLGIIITSRSQELDRTLRPHSCILACMTDPQATYLGDLVTIA